MDVVMFVIVSIAIAVAVFVNAYRCGRRGSVPLMMERAGIAVMALFVGCMVFVDSVFYVWLGALGLALLLLAGSTAARKIDAAAQEQLVARAGGPQRVRRLSAWLVAGGAGIVLAIPIAAAIVLVGQWADSISRVAKTVTATPDPEIVAALRQEGEQLVMWAIAVMFASLIPLAAAAVAGWIQYRRRRTAARDFEAAVLSWGASHTDEDWRLFLVDMQHVRLAYRLGLAKPGSTDRDG